MRSKGYWGWALVLPLGCAPSEEEIQQQFEAYVAERNGCATTDDCVIVIGECPLPCTVAVNRAHQDAVAAKSSELASDYESGGTGCDYRCAPATAICTEGRCAVQR